MAAYAGEREIDIESVTVTATTEDTDIIEVSQTSVTGLKAGTATVLVSAKFGNSETVYTQVNVEVTEDGVAGFTATAKSRRIRPDSEGTQIEVEGTSFHGLPFDLSGAEITYTTEDTDVITVSDTGYVTPVAVGTGYVTVTVKKAGFEESRDVEIVVTTGKVGSSYYTEERVSAARENVSKYTWARSQKNTAVAQADSYIENIDVLWDMISTQEVPRAVSAGYRNDPEASRCRYCNTDLTKYGDIYFFWKVDPFNNPWKIQCPECRKSFPTNDFGSFYKLGIVQAGEEDIYGVPTSQWSYEKSHYEHYKLFANEYAAKGVETYEEHKAMRDAGERLPAVGYLKNDLYPEVATVSTLNGGRGLNLETETVEGWGVDDGYGYKTGHVYQTASGEREEAHVYISHYNEKVWTYELSTKILKNIYLAYLFTGEAKYGRAGAIMVDRIADVYPQMYIAPFFPNFANSDGSHPYGKITGRIREPEVVYEWIYGYDALYDMYDDPYV
ncbi:MAG: Ig-like domain-containing protein, partial [Clostridia bacterium]|nr:Ig-like domain-containing protein [Clostridia bacterium]